MLNFSLKIVLVVFAAVLGHARRMESPAPAFLAPLYQFTGKLFTALDGTTGSQESGNVIVSPISVHTALNMVLLGADANTTTKRELLDSLGFAGLSEAEVLACHGDYSRALVEFREVTAKSLDQEKEDQAEGESEQDFKRRMRYGHLGPRPPVLDLFTMVITKNSAQVLDQYKEDVERHYHSSLVNVEDSKPETKTQLIERLNSWAKEAGFGQPIMSNQELSAQFEAILLSAVRVQAAWFEKFDERRAERIFYQHGLEDRPVDGQALSLTGVERARYLELTDTNRTQFRNRNQRLSASSEAIRQLSSLNAQVVQVPLVGGLSYTIFEPLEYSTPGDNKLNKLVGQLFAEQPGQGVHSTKLATALDLLDGEQGDVTNMRLEMPKFKFEKEIGLVGALQSMGLRRVFDKNAEINSMTGRKLRVSDVIHQAVIDVNESGIKAAGVTKVRMEIDSLNEAARPPLRVSIRKPFLFLIRYGKIPLFVGQLTSLSNSWNER